VSALPKFFGPDDPQCEARLVCDQLGFAYEPSQWIVQGLSLDLPARGAFRIAGGMGSGVSTLLKLMSGILSAQTGEVRWGGIRVDSKSMFFDAKWRLSCGYVPRAGGLLANQDLLSNTILPIVYHGWANAEAASRMGMEYFHQVGLGQDANRLPAWASPTARKTALLLRALLPQPQILFLDEPADGLSNEGVHQIQQRIQWHQAHLGLRLIVVGSQDKSWDVVLGTKEIKMAAGKLENNRPW
jgi:polar amino acid transport system ATP-binding protein